MQSFALVEHAAKPPEYSSLTPLALSCIDCAVNCTATSYKVVGHRALLLPASLYKEMPVAVPAFICTFKAGASTLTLKVNCEGRLFSKGSMQSV